VDSGSIVKQVVRKIILTIRFFTEKRVMSEAAALTYSSLLAIVPVLAVVFAIARGFGYNKYIEMWFLNSLSSQPEAASVIVGFVNSYLVHIQGGVFLGIGLIFMLYTVLMLVNNIEETFNQIWRVSNTRPIMRSLVNYLAMFLLFPIIIIISTGLSIFMATIADKMEDFVLLGPAVSKLLDLSPFILLSVLFIVLYIYMPNTKVKFSCAIVPGILAGIAMQILQLVYIHAQIWVTGYNAIYGSFAALPLFMLWVQFSWTICLFGAQLTYTNQNLNRFGINLEPLEIHPKIDMTDDERGPEATAIYADTIDAL
jgi:membrane protein